MVARNPDLVDLPCPECRERGRKGDARIGNRRSVCGTCNAFVQNVMRLTRKKLMEAHRDEYLSLRLRVEADLYPQVIEKWSVDHAILPEALLGPDPIEEVWAALVAQDPGLDPEGKGPRAWGGAL